MKFLQKLKTNICLKERLIGFVVTLIALCLCVVNYYHQDRVSQRLVVSYVDAASEVKRLALQLPSTASGHVHYVADDATFSPRAQATICALKVENCVADAMRDIEESIETQVNLSENHAKAMGSQSNSLLGIWLFSPLLCFMSWKLYSLGIPG